MAKIKDTDYLSLSARVRVMELSLLTKERMERMLEARTNEEAVKVLSECGYAELNPVTPEGVDRILTQRRDTILKEMERGLPDPALLEVFKVKYDYHNLKTLLKAQALEKNYDRLLVNTGRIPAETVKQRVEDPEKKGTLPKAMELALEEAREVLGATGDPQRLDLVLDRAYFADMAELVETTGSKYLQGYVAILIDAANLRTLVRAIRMRKSVDFLKGVLFAGGQVSVDKVLTLAANEGSGMEEAYSSTQLRSAAAIGAGVTKGGGLTAFEKECDNAVTRYLAGAKYIPFGEAPIIGYLAAVDSELTNLRIILSGRMAGLDAETIRERLRDAYV